MQLGGKAFIVTGGRAVAALVRHVCENTMLNGETIQLDGALRMAPRWRGRRIRTRGRAAAAA